MTENSFFCLEQIHFLKSYNISQYQTRCAQILWKSRSHFKILGHRAATWSILHTEKQILGATKQNSVRMAIWRKQFLQPCPRQWIKSRNQVALTVMYIHHKSLELTTTIYSEDTNFCRFRRCTNIYGYNGWLSIQGTCKVILVVLWWRKKICRNRIRVVLLFWDVRPRYYLIVSRRFETRKRSHLQGSKCPRQRIFWPLQIWPLRRH
jgi:hypothetical protein